MTPEEVREIRDKLGLSQTGLAVALRLGTNGKRTVARWEAGATIPGPATVALEAYRDGWRPGDGSRADIRTSCLEALDGVAAAVTEARRKVQAVGQGKDGA